MYHLYAISRTPRTLYHVPPRYYATYPCYAMPRGTLTHVRPRQFVHWLFSTALCCSMLLAVSQLFCRRGAHSCLSLLKCGCLMIACFAAIIAYMKRTTKRRIVKRLTTAHRRRKRGGSALPVILFLLVAVLLLLTRSQKLPSLEPVGTDTTVTASSPDELFPQAREALPICSHGEDHEAHEYAGFWLCYRESYETAEWVFYELTAAGLGRKSKRSNDFREDKSITTGSASLADYKGSGFDRGHLAPARDMAYSDEAMSESFLMSNMTPQAPAFNRGMWKDLEEQVRLWAFSFGRVFVATGPLWEKEAADYAFIGLNQVRVPEYFYKALLAKTDAGWQAVGFILPNAKCEGDLADYVVAIDEIEVRCGVDFFAFLEDSVENEIEAATVSAFTRGW